MPDGQEKSDDLIAELAKLMASNAGSSEPEARPAPKLVTLPDDTPRQEGQGPQPVRIPGMDAPQPPSPPAAPFSVAPAPAPSPVNSAESAPPAASAAPGVFRIPGMDEPVAASTTPTPVTAPVPPAATAAPAPEPVVARPASVDFGTTPPATAFKPEPMSNWQDREIPRPPVASRPAPSLTPSPAPIPTVTPPRPVSVSPAPAPAAPAPAPEPALDPMAELEAALMPQLKTEASPAAPAPAAPAAQAAAPRPSAPAAAPMVAAAQAAPATDSFDFDFGFDTSPPEPIATAKPATPAPAASAPAPSPAPAPKPAAPVSSDPIADLIAAELDSPPEMPVAAAPAPQPAPRPFPQPGVTPAPRPQSNAAFGRGPAPQASQPSGRPEDRFGVAPVFGPASKVQAPQRPQPAVDPMDEIESLIGEAVRVELTSEKQAPAPVSAPARASEPEIEEEVEAEAVEAEAEEPAPAPQAAPVVPPLNTGFAPRRASLRDAEPQVPSAEAAILAAAAASGAEVGRVDNVRPEPSPYKRVKARPERRSGGMRQYVGMAVAGTLLLAAGFGLYWVLGMSRGTDAEAPVLQADATPVKEVPPPAATTTANQGSVVFSELDGNSTPAEEQLVSRDDSEATSVADVATTVGSSAAPAGESELANRKVRTVTVRPDGTIVSGDDAVAGNEELPVDRPAVPDLPGADVQPSELLAAVPSSTVADPIGEAISTDATQTSALSAAPANVDPSIVAPIPVARPVDRSALNGGSRQSVAASQPAAVSQPAATIDGSGPYVQLSSQPTQADAQNSLRTTQNRLSGLLAGRSLAIRPVDLGAKGTWYRVVLPVDSFQEATQTCASLKANGVDCVPIGG